MKITQPVGIAAMTSSRERNKCKTRCFLILLFFTETSAFYSLIHSNPNKEICKSVRSRTLPHSPKRRVFSSTVTMKMSLHEKEKLIQENLGIIDNLSVEPIIASRSPLDGEESDKTNGTLGIWAARGILLLVAALWGTNFASVKYLENLCFHPPCVHPPSEFAFARFGIASIVSLPFLWNQRKDIILGGLECGFWITLGYFTQASALKTVPSGQCAFICSLTVVVVPLMSSLFFGKSIKRSNIYSAIMAFVGVGVLEGMIDLTAFAPPALADSSVVDLGYELSRNTIESSSQNLAEATFFGIDKGRLLAIGQPFGFGLSFMRIEHYVEKFKDVENRIMTISAAQCVAVGFLSFLWVLYDYNGVIPNMAYMVEPHRIGAIAWTGIMTTVFAIYLEGFALQVASASEAALTFASEPVWASIFGAWLLHEKLGLNSYIGGSIILGACVFGALGDLQDEQDSTHNPVEVFDDDIRSTFR